jgi:uncharacterized protein
VALTMYEVSVPAMVRSLGVLSVYLDKVADFAKEKSLPVRQLLEARLAPDMFTLGQQIQRACDKSKLGVARIAGVEAPKFEDNEATVEEFKERIAKSIAFLQSIDKAKLEGSESRMLELNLRAAKGQFRADWYLLSVLLPDFYFHVTTAHDILRNQGVQIGKLDYFGRL